MPEGSSARFRWLKFRFSTLLLLFVIFAMGIGWWQDWHRRQRPLYLHVIIASVNKGEKRMPSESVAVTSIIPNQAFHAEQTKYRSVEGLLTVSPTGHYHLNFSGNFKNGFNYDGPIELEELTLPSGVSFSGAIFPYSFAISEFSDASDLLEKQNETEYWNMGADNSP